MVGYTRTWCSPKAKVLREIMLLVILLLYKGWRFMVHPVQVGKRTRMSFAKVKDVTEMPNLIEVQLDSYEWFLKEGSWNNI